MSRGLHRIVGLVLRISLSVALLLAPALLAQERPELRVRYRSKESVYLDGGTRVGLAEGDRLEVRREGRVIGKLEVVFVAESSASCRVLSEIEPILPADRVFPIGELTSAPGPEQLPEAESASTTASTEEADLAPVPYSPPSSSRKRRQTRVSGVVELGWDSFKDDSEAGLDFERLAARLSLRMRDIAGTPLQLRVRLRTQENRRERSFSSGAPQNETRNRFYEAALVYDPEGGRFKAQAGRIAASPFVSVGFLDGIIAQARIIPAIDVGALFGSQPVIQDDSFDTFGQKYGVYTRFSALRHGGRPDLEIFVAGIREEGDLDVSREYVSLEARYTPAGRWSLYQRAELDLNNGWREEASGTSTQLSNLALTLDTRLSRFSRFSISYDRWERYYTEESRSISEELFDNLLRQGLRLRYSLHRRSGLGFSVYAGYRDRQGDEDRDSQNTGSFGGALRYSNLWIRGLSVSGDILGYTNPLTEGMVVRLQTSQRFSRGHEISLLIGGRFYQDKLHEDVSDRNDNWIRLAGWLELPFDLFAVPNSNTAMATTSRVSVFSWASAIVSSPTFSPVVVARGRKCLEMQGLRPRATQAYCQYVEEPDGSET